MKTASPLPKVRQALPEDFPQLMELCRLLHTDNAMLEAYWPAVEAVIMHGINGNRACIGVIGPVGQLKGMIYLRMGELWYSDEITLEELYCFVPREHRQGGKNAEALVRYAKDAADRLGLRLLTGIITKKRLNAKQKLYEKILGPHNGVYFFYDPREGVNGQRKQAEVQQQ